jgi:nucleotide-binding universal stress UspA family protein
MDIKSGTIVVGVDDSESSMRALAWAVEQAVAEHRALTLVHSIGAAAAFPGAAPASPAEAPDGRGVEGRRVLDRARAEVVRTAPGLEVHEVFRLTDPREALVELSHDAAMVVLGSRGRGKLPRLLLGSVGVALVRHAACPVVVHRPGNPGLVRNGIVVGADASEDSRTVLEFAYREASLRDLPLTVLHCLWDMQAAVSAASMMPQPVAEPFDLETERMLLSEALAGMSEKYPEVAVHIEMARGLPQEALVRLGERMNLVVVGAHQSGRVSRMLFGLVSISVVEHATCPVAVVPLSIVE